MHAGALVNFALLPGDLVTVKPDSLLHLWGSEMTRYTRGYSNGIVIQPSYRLIEEDLPGEHGQGYLVLLSGELRIYLVSEGRLLTTAEVVSLHESRERLGERLSRQFRAALG